MGKCTRSRAPRCWVARWRGHPLTGTSECNGEPAARPDGGWPLIGIGLLLIGWAVRTIREPDGRHPTGLKTTGPYAFTHNPMYVGWTALYLGLALVLNTAWLFVVFPGW